MVDIDKAPLGDYENGMIDDNGNSDEEDGDELEEIEERVFNGSQPAKGVANRTMNYSDVEDVCLVRAWESISLDALSSTDQTGKKI
jgi:hypothetical protein